MGIRLVPWLLAAAALVLLTVWLADVASAREELHPGPPPPALNGTSWEQVFALYGR